MDETPVWNDMVSNNTVEKTGSKVVSRKSITHDKVHVSICLTGKVDGTRLTPFIVFKGAKRESTALHDEFNRKCYMACSDNEWMNEELTLRCCNEILGQFSVCKHLIAWDSFEARLTDYVKETLRKSKIERVLAPRECTKYIQAADVVWI